MVTRKELIVRPGLPEQQGPTGVARRSPDGLSEVSLEFDPEACEAWAKRAGYGPIAEHTEKRATFVQNIIINGDYHYRDEAGSAFGALSTKLTKQERKAQRYREEQERADRQERFDRRDSTIQLGIFASYVVVLVVVVFLTFCLAAMGMIHR